jgi:hypothetical protein
MSRRRALTNLTVAPPEHAEEMGTLKDLGPTNQALWMLVLATNSQLNCFGKHVEFRLPQKQCFFWQFCGTAKMAMIHNKI